VTTRRTSASSVPARPYNPNCTLSSTSPVITKGLPDARLSSVAETPPSTEFSIGTSPARTVPSRTASSVAATEGNGVASSSSFSDSNA